MHPNPSDNLIFHSAFRPLQRFLIAFHARAVLIDIDPLIVVVSQGYAIATLEDP